MRGTNQSDHRPGQNASSSRSLFIAGPAGKLETVVAEPAGAARGIAVIAHPHPLFGGTMDNKVVYTLFKTLLELGFIAVKFNFRGVGKSEGAYSGDGLDETEDVLAIVRAVQEEFSSRFEASAPLLLAGFSFGGAIQAFVAEKLKPDVVIMVSPAVERMNAPIIAVPTHDGDSGISGRILIVQGDQDDVVPLKSVLEWAAPQELPVVVIPGAEHFFHRRLHILKRVVSEFCRP